MYSESMTGPVTVCEKTGNKKRQGAKGGRRSCTLGRRMIKPPCTGGEVGGGEG